MASTVELNKRTDHTAAAQAVKQELVDPNAEGQHDASAATAPLQPRKDRRRAPLSFAQKRLWFLDQINPGDVAANISRGVRIGGALDLEVLEQALRAIVARHESLRTTFAKTELSAGTDSRPLQLVAENGSVDLSLINLSHVSENEREQRAKEIARDEAQRTFDLTLGPLLRVTLLRLDNCDHVLLLNAHQIVCDEWSTRIFLNELWECYHTLVSGERPRLEETPVQYSDYAQWQRDWLRGDALGTQLDYWRNKLADAPAVIDLPTDRLRPAVQTWRGSSASTILDKDVTELLKALSVREGATLFMVLLAAFQVLLARYSRQSDILVGSLVANRDVEGVRGLIGAFANSLVFRTDLSGNLTFLELLGLVKTIVSEAQAHQSAPFEKVIEELRVERSLGHAPVFQTMFNLNSPRGTTFDVDGLRVEPFEFETGIAPLELSLNVIEEPEQLNCRLLYNTDLFDVGTITRMLGHFRQLLAGITDNPGERIGRLPLLTEPERKQIIFSWNQTDKVYPQGQCTHELFERQVEKTPNAIAVVCGPERLTFAELNRRVNQLANYLKTVGVGPESRVGICLGRSIRMLVGVLGTLKAGGAYVPLDPAYPRERLAFMLKDSGAAVLLTEKDFLPTLTEITGVICLDSEWETIAKCSDLNPVNASGAENLAYVIYTSGSTGEPKGVAIQHSSTVTFLNWTKKVFAPRELEGVLASTSLCFDLSVFELFAPLCSGGKVIIVENALQLRELQSADVTLVNTVPSAMAELVRDGGLPPSVRTVNLAGEPLRNNLAQKIYENETIEKVFNLYGPSEDTTYSTFALVQKGTLIEPSIGQPIANTVAYVLDSYLEPVPIGVPAELYLGGAGLARCYLERSELTAAKFVPDPFSDRPGARLYRTGDLAQYRTDGSLRFVGRVDHQVKIRGFRIELGEIETLLKKHAAVRDVVVLPREGNDALVAYIVADKGEWDAEQTTLTSVLRSHLATKLPDYMVPALFVELEALPLTPNGKIDRRALSVSKDYRPEPGPAHVAPRNDLEEQLIRLWQKVLGVESIGVKHNFFELGGHSLLAARLFAQIENRFGRNLSLATLFQAPTIEQLAEVLRASESQNKWSSLVAIQPNGSRPPLFCVHAAGANVLIYRPLARHLGMEQPVYALQAQGLDGQTEPYVCVEDMAAHYLKEMRAFQPEGPYYLLGASFGGLVIFEMARHLIAAGQQVALLAMLNTNCPVYSVAKRLRCHVGHLMQKGPKTYVQASMRSIIRRIGKASSREGLTEVADHELREAIASCPDGNDPLVRTVLANLQAESDYAPSEKTYPGKITFFWARDAERDFEDNRLAWRKLAAGGFEFHIVPGNHTSMREEPNVALLTEKLRPCLEKGQAAHR